MAPGWVAVRSSSTLPGFGRAGVGLRAVPDTLWRASGRLIDTRCVVVRYPVTRQG